VQELGTVAVMPETPRDPLLRSVRAGAPDDEFVDLVLSRVRWALRPVPSPSGTWTEEEIEEVTYDFLADKWSKIELKAWELHTDDELRAWMTKVVANYVHDRGRETPSGRLKRRIGRIVGDMGDLRLEGGRVHGVAPGGVVRAHDRDALLEPLWKISTTTAWWSAEGEEDPTPGDREDLMSLIRGVVATADGPSSSTCSPTSSRIASTFRWGGASATWTTRSPRRTCGSRTRSRQPVARLRPGSWLG
jgi:hypothetical protein